MLLPWMQTLIASVPADFAPELSPAGEGETVKGSMPAEIAVWYNASVWALKEADRVHEEHEREHEQIDLDRLRQLDLNAVKNMANACAEARNKQEQLKNRAAILGVAAREALIEHFGLKATDNVEVRAEGVVVIESDPFESFFSSLEGSGISVVRI